MVLRQLERLVEEEMFAEVTRDIRDFEEHLVRLQDERVEMEGY